MPSVAPIPRAPMPPRRAPARLTGWSVDVVERVAAELYLCRTIVVRGYRVGPLETARGRVIWWASAPDRSPLLSVQVVPVTVPSALYEQLTDMGYRVDLANHLACTEAYESDLSAVGAACAFVRAIERRYPHTWRTLIEAALET